jgi:hypothetical protein
MISLRGEVWAHETSLTLPNACTSYVFQLNTDRLQQLGDYFIMILLSIYIYNWTGNKFLQLTSPSPYKYINSINKTNQMTANVQAI